MTKEEPKMDNAINEMPVREMTEAEKPALRIVEQDKPQPRKKSGKAKARAAKARPVEELAGIPVKQMTDKEKENYIEHLREQLTIADNKVEQYKQNNESVFAQVRMMEDNFNAMESYFTDRLNYVQEAAKNFYKSVCLATKGDVK